MTKHALRKALTAFLMMALLVTSFASIAVAQDDAATQDEAAAPAPVEAVASNKVSGMIPGGQFATIWLGLTPSALDANVTVTADWDRENPTANGLVFYVLNARNTNAAMAGGRPQDNNIAAGVPVFQGANNQQSASFRASESGLTLIVSNTSPNDANFTLTAQNAIITDNSGAVRDANAPVEAATETAPAAEEAAAEQPAAEAPATTEASAAVTPTVAAEATPEPAAAAAAETAPAAVATPFVLRASEVAGALPEQSDQHYLGLEPEFKDSEMTLLLTFDPMDSQELARRLNFWVLDEAGFKAYQNGTPASEVAFGAGSRTFTGQTNERQATFRAAGTGPYTVIVYNNSNVPGTYTLKVDGGFLIDDSLQTTTAQQQAATAPAASTGVTTTVPAGTTAAATAPAASTATTGTTTAGREGEPGGTYTVSSGDTIALIARDIYGDYTLYTAICSFNGIADCNRIEIGDVINLPTLEQINAGAKAPATAAAATTAPVAAATPATAPVATAPAATTATTTTAAAETTATTATTATTPATTATTTTTTTTTAAVPTPTRAAAATSGAQSLVDVAAANPNFTILVKAIEAAGLEDELQGAGPFTIFAPTDAAFQKLGSATVDALLKDTKQLSQILLFHVVPSKVLSTDLTDGKEAVTLQGSPVEFTVSGSTAKVQDSVITVPDVLASNGVIQVIDQVMLPPTP